VKSCEDAGVLGVIPGILGALQANQVISILLGNGSPLVGRLLVFNGLDNTFEELKIKKNEACRVCGPNPTVNRLVDYEAFCGLSSRTEPTPFDVTPLELKASMEEEDAPLVLDVREPYEFSICHLDNAALIPMGQLTWRMEELDKAREIVVYCHVGVRSTNAVSLLRQAGFRRARNLKGGIDAWASEVDPSMPRY
jgi:adenylyltransferase/sulfurtransferase